MADPDPVFDGAVAAAFVGCPVSALSVVLLGWAFGLGAWLWLLPVSCVVGFVAVAVLVGFLEGVAESPDPGGRKAPPKTPRRASRRKTNVIDLAAERKRRVQ
jgi:hypothetical protein